MTRLPGAARKLLFGLLVAIVAVGFAYSFPADIALMAAIDSATWVEALAGVLMAASVIKLRSIPLMARSMMSAGLRRIARIRHARQARRRAVAKRDDRGDRAAAWGGWNEGAFAA